MSYFNKKVLISLTLVAVATVLAVAPRANEKLAADYYPSYGYSGQSGFNGQPSGQIYQSSTVMPLGTCIYTDTISWTTQNVSQAEVTVSDSTSGQKIFATGTQGSAATPWLVPGDSYNFVLWNLSNGQQTFLAQTTINLSTWTCNGQNSGGSFPTPTPTPFGSGTGSGNFSLTSNNQFCVGQVPVYSITSSAAWANQTIDWTSSFNGSVNSQTSFVLNSNGNWTASGNAWSSSNIGSWQKTAQINGVTQTLNFTVQNCGGSSGSFPTPTPTPVGSFGSGSFSLSSNNQFCVGQTPTYTISSSPAWANQTINWTSSHNGSINSQANFLLDGSGNWTASGNTWQSNDVGSWQKTAVINGVSQNLSFSVQNCGGSTGFNPTPTPTPINSGGFGNFTLVSNNQFCVGQSPVYTITASTNTGEQTINWTSSHGGSINNQTTFSLINGFWTASGEPWGNNDVGQWQKTATINGVSQTLTFNVQNCGNSSSDSSSSGDIGGGVGTGSGAIGGSVGNSNGGTIGGGVGTSNDSFGGSVGNDSQTFGGSVGNENQTIGGSVGSSSSGIIGSGVN